MQNVVVTLLHSETRCASNSQILVLVNVVIIACNRVIDTHHNRRQCDVGAAFVRSIAKNGKVRH